MSEFLEPMQETLRGIETEIQRHEINLKALQSSIERRNIKVEESTKSIESICERVKIFKELQFVESEKFEDFLSRVENEFILALKRVRQNKETEDLEKFSFDRSIASVLRSID